MTVKIFSVSEVTSAIRSLIEPQFRGISVRGEISNCKTQSSGHLYFSLKDTDAQISVALFRSSAASLSRSPKDGDQVIVKGEVGVYPPRGSYQIIARELQFLGAGELLLQFHRLKEALQARGWFDPSRKKPLPKLPHRIGVITSPTGAVIQDILQILTRRFSGLQILLNPVKVQGEGAAHEIASAIQQMNQFDLADVLIVGRGGGSIEDLWAFNEEIVAKAIFESRIPVISAVGHETDFTIADWVADARAPTPSAAAEMAIAEKNVLFKFVENTSLQIARLFSQQLRGQREHLRALSMHPLLSQPHSLLAHSSMRLDNLQQAHDMTIQQKLQTLRLRLNSIHQRLELARPAHQLATLRQQLNTQAERLNQTTQHSIEAKQKALTHINFSLGSLHPKNLLQKGYCLLFSEKDRSIILSIEDLQPGQPFTAVLADGRVQATTSRIERRPPDGSIV